MEIDFTKAFDVLGGEQWDAKHCTCDESVGMTPCHYCVLHHCLRKAKKEVTRLRNVDGEPPKVRCSSCFKAVPMDKMHIVTRYYCSSECADKHHAKLDISDYRELSPECGQHINL